MAKQEKKVSREKQGVITGIVGLVLNLLLGGGKLIAGLISGSVAVMSDAANNLSDAGNSLVTTSSFFLSSRKADREHPYGHGRYEYIASLIIGIIILFVAFQFALTSVSKIINPVKSEINIFAMCIMGASILVKLFMGFFYLSRGKKIDSSTLKAASFDSFSDCMVTGAVILGIVIGMFLPFSVDGILGVLVSVVIFYGGIKIITETVSRLLGGRCSHEIEQKVKELIVSGEGIVGMHDLKVHDYGPNMAVASVHAEFNRDMSISTAHAIIDDIEHRAHSELSLELVIHCDPIDTSDLFKNRVRHTIKDIIRLYDAHLHDLNINYEAKDISFHVGLPERYSKRESYIRECLTIALKDLDQEFTSTITIDIEY